MEKPNYKLIVFLVAVAVLLGTVGGALFGGVAGYYAATLAQSNAPVAAPAAATAATAASPATPLLQAAPPITSNNSGTVTLKEDSAVIDAVNKTKPAVVTVINQMQAQSGGRGFSRRGSGGSVAPVASGSGVIIDQQGYIVTNNHVIDGEQSLQVIYADGSKADATLVGTDPVLDIAVLKVNGKVPAVAQFGDSNTLVPGQVAIALGSPLGDFRGTVTVGVVSALNRTVDTQQGLIQTDAAINNGNSGGPLINSQGQVIGINTLVVRDSGNGNPVEGLGFAIPSNLVHETASQLIANGSVQHPYIGVSYQSMDQQMAGALNSPTTQGVVVQQVEAGSPAAKAGIQQNDIILAVNGSPIDQDHPLVTVLFSHKPGETVTLNVLRGSQQMQIKLTLGVHPTGQLSTPVGTIG